MGAVVLQHTPMVLRVLGDDEAPIVTVSEDGGVEFAPGFSPDSAARAFWETVAALLQADALAPLSDPFSGNTDSLCQSIRGLLRVSASRRPGAEPLPDNARVLLTAACMRLESQNGRKVYAG
jgi:hypothetical protein